MGEPIEKPEVEEEVERPRAKHLGPGTRVEPEPLTVPARMVNELLYCERLAYLEWVQGEWADNAFTEEGRWSHRRADEKSGGLPTAEAERPYTARSVWLSSERLQLAAKIDVVEGEGDAVVPIEYKRGTPPEVPEGAYLPERAQLCVQVLLLREHGFRCDEAQLYFAGARRRVSILIDDALIATTLDAAARARAFADRDGPPPPLVDSPKCNGCSLVGICLPDETNALAKPEAQVEDDAPRPLRRLHPARDDRKPVYVQEQGARVGIDGECLAIRGKDGMQQARLVDTSHVALFGNVSLSAQATRTLAERGIPVLLFSYGGWFSARIVGLDGKNVELRIAQHRAADEPTFCLELARTIIASKIRNARTMLRRNHAEPDSALLKQLEAYAKDAERAEGLPSLLGIEGSAARAYFGAFSGMFRASGLEFSLEGRNRRPPKDPVNALLSFVYALLVKEIVLACTVAGLDPLRGFYHQSRFGRPSLALDLMEELRPILGDSVVIGVLNNGIVDASDFVVHREGVALSQSARKKVIQAFERRLEQEITHPVFGYAISWRRVLEVQARLLGRLLLGEIDAYPAMRTR